MTNRLLCAHIAEYAFVNDLCEFVRQWRISPDLDSGLDEQDRGLWRAGDALFQVATTTADPDPADRYQSVAELIGAWQHARGNRRPRPG